MPYRTLKMNPKPLMHYSDLSTHRDDSDVTLNVRPSSPTSLPRSRFVFILPSPVLQVCLGKQFTGGSLFFCNTGIPPFDFRNPRQMPPVFDFHHEVGTAVVHLGRLQHGKCPLRIDLAAAAAAAAEPHNHTFNIPFAPAVKYFTLHKKTPSTFQP